MEGQSMVFRISNIFLRNIHLGVLAAATSEGLCYLLVTKWSFGQQNALSGIDISSHLLRPSRRNFKSDAGSSFSIYLEHNYNEEFTSRCFLTLSSQSLRLPCFPPPRTPRSFRASRVD